MMLVGYAMFGAFVRAAYGVYNAYSNYQSFSLSWKRILVEFAASVIFGMFGAVILDQLGFWQIGTNIVAILAGLFGANIIRLITKKFGIGGKLDVNIVEKVDYPDLGVNQQRAMGYLKANGKITSSIYRQINQISRAKAKWELNQMVLKGYVRVVGSRKGAYYRYVKVK